MVSIQTKKKSIIRKPISYLCTGLILIVAGYITFNYSYSIVNALKTFFRGAVTVLKDFISPLSEINIPLNVPTMITAVLLALSAWFIVKGIKSIIHNFKDSDVIRLLSKLPSDYYLFNEVKIENNLIDHIVVCPKGIFTIDTKNWKDSAQKNLKYNKQYNMIKQGILNSKLLNDFLQKNQAGNYFVNTIVVFADWDEKLKEHFSDIPVLQPEQLTQHITSFPDKYSFDECKKIADALKINLSPQVSPAKEKSQNNEDISKKKSAQKV